MVCLSPNSLPRMHHNPGCDPLPAAQRLLELFLTEIHMYLVCLDRSRRRASHMTLSTSDVLPRLIPALGGLRCMSQAR